MGNLIGYSAVATKLRAMESRLLKDEDYRQLAKMESVAQAAAYLMNRPAYREVLSRENAAELKWEDLERLFLGTLFYDYSKLYHFCNKRQREFLKLYFGKYEISIIKRSLRRIFNHGDRTGESIQNREAMQKFSDVHMEELAHAETIPEFLEALGKTRYRSVLARLGDSEDTTLFDYEMTLDLYYFSEMWKKKRYFLKGKDLDVLTKTFGTTADLLNMMWIYRAKKYYQLPEGTILTLIIPIAYKLRDDEIRDMVMAAGPGELNEVIRRTYYRRQFLDLSGEELERFYNQFLKKIYTEERRKNPYSIAVVTSYLYDKEEELDKLTIVLEGARYGLDPRETLAYAGQ